MKRTAWIVVGLLVMGCAAQAASFDCGKARSKVEHIICDNPEISKLDDDLNTAYKAAVQDKQQAEVIKQAQKQWMKKRNVCADSACVEQAYEMRLSTLSSSDGKGAKHDAKQGFSYTDDYVLDPAPKEMIDWNLEEYKKPRDKKVCSLYLQNLQYFARRNDPMSCGQPIAPMLKDKIKKVEWENLDPEKYPDLFKAIVKVTRTRDKEPSNEELNGRRLEIREGGVVFRRLKFDLKGSPGVEEGSNRPLPEADLSVIQYGYDVTRPDNPQTTWRCHPLKGRIMPSYTEQTELHLFIVAKDLSHIFDSLRDWRGYSGQNLWLINERVYGEFYDELANVKLTELRKTDFGSQLVLEPVCLYHFKNTSHKE